MSIALPISEILKDLSAIKDSHLIINAAPGAGKTTVVPQYLLDNYCPANKKVLVLEPRRLAAILAARTIANQRAQELGREVGYQIRFDNKSSKETRLLFMTEGTFINKYLEDPQLTDVAIVIIDEVHERHKETDIALALLKNLIAKEETDLRIVLMSATANLAQLNSYINNSKTINCSVPHHKLDIFYRAEKNREDLAEHVYRVVQEALQAESSGSILVFLAGSYEINKVYRKLASLPCRIDILHAEINATERDRIVTGTQQQRIILSTNVAESSITIPDVRTVIDSGVSRKVTFSPWSMFNTRSTARIAKSNCIQRAGRAARLGPGRCYRLYSQTDYELRAEFESPEILVSDLSELILMLKSLGVNDVKDLTWLDQPITAQIEAANDLLLKLKATDYNHSITSQGRALLKFGLPVRLAKFISELKSSNHKELALLIAIILSNLNKVNLREALTKNNNPLVELLYDFHKDKLASYYYDQCNKIFKRLNYNYSAAEDSLKQLLLESDKNSLSESKIYCQIISALLLAFPDRIAQKTKTGYRLIDGSNILQKSSNTKEDPAFILVLDLEEKFNNTKNPELKLKFALECPEQIIFDLFSSDLESHLDCVWNNQRKAVECFEQLKLSSLVLIETRKTTSNNFSAAMLLFDNSIDQLTAIDKQKIFEELQIKINLIKVHNSDLELPILNQELIREIWLEICKQNSSYAELEKFIASNDFYKILRLKIANFDLISDLTPDYLFFNNNQIPAQYKKHQAKKLKIHYTLARSPYISARLQDLAGVSETPKILAGKLALSVELLAPNNRPLQVTNDLKSFWSKHYPELKVSLARRYPKHYWP